MWTPKNSHIKSFRFQKTSNFKWLFFLHKIDFRSIRFLNLFYPFSPFAKWMLKLIIIIRPRWGEVKRNISQIFILFFTWKHRFFLKIGCDSCKNRRRSRTNVSGANRYRLTSVTRSDQLVTNLWAANGTVCVTY